MKAGQKEDLELLLWHQGTLRWLLNRVYKILKLKIRNGAEMPQHPELLEIRNQIDLIDNQIVPLLVQRVNLALRASDYKSTEQEVRGCDRVKIVLDKVGKLATMTGGHDVTIQNIYGAIIKELTDLQLKKKGV